MNPSERRPGGRYEFADAKLGQQLKGVHGLLEKLHDYRHARCFQSAVSGTVASGSPFPQEELDRFFDVFRLPSLFGGGAYGLPGPIRPPSTTAPAESTTIKDDKFDLDPTQKQAADEIDKARKDVQLLSESFNIHERLAVNYWLDACEPSNLSLICQHFGYASNHFERGSNRRLSAAEHLYCMERLHVLDIIILLMSMRGDSTNSTTSDKINDNPSLYDKEVARYTNRLLHPSHGDIIKVLLNVVKHDSTHNQLTEKTALLATNYMQKLALAIMHSCHQLQVAAAEEELMVNVIHHLAKEIVDDESRPDAAGEGSLFVINVGLPAALVVLQIAYIHITREEGFVYLTDNVDSNNDVDIKIIDGRANSLFDGIKKRFEQGTNEFLGSCLPSCQGMQGLQCLAYARMLHYPAVGAEPFQMAKPSCTKQMVLEAFREANERRAYSYLRLCVLPMLQSFKVLVDDSSDGSLALLTRVLKEFLWEISVIVVDPEYTTRETLDTQTSSRFFDVHPTHSTQKHRQQQQRLSAPAFSSYSTSSSSSSYSTLAWGASHNHTPSIPLQVDCLTDITLLYSAFIATHPSFAIQYIKNPAGRPFVDKVLHGCGAHAMQVPAMRLLAQLASTPFRVSDAANDGAAKRVYDIVRQQAPLDLSWSHLANDRLLFYAKRFGKMQDDPNVAAGSMYNNASTWGELGQGLSGSYSRDAFEITPEIEEDIEAIAGLFAGVFNQPRLQSIDEATGPLLIGTFFQLLACPLSLSAKGAIFRALAAYTRTCDDQYACEVWKLLTQYRLLPSIDDYTASMTGGIPLDTYRTGLRLELQETEARAGIYTITDGFLLLLESLLSHGLPHRSIHHSHSQSQSVSPTKSVVVYIDYVVEEILAAAETRYYDDASPHPSVASRKSTAQKWKIYARCYKILSTVLQHYGINQLGDHALSSTFDKTAQHTIAVDFREDDAVPQVGTANAAARLLKSPGFLVMSLMLSTSKNSLQKSIAHLLEHSGLEKIEETDTLSKFRDAHGAVRAMCDTRLLSPLGDLADPTACDDFDRRGGSHDGVFCESTYWHVKAISAVTGLLYECGLREKSFIEHVHAAPQVSVAIVSKTCLVAVAVKIQSLAQVLAQHASLERLAMLLCFPTSLCASVPSIPVMAAYLVKSAALELPGAFAIQAKDDSLMLGCCRSIVIGDRPLGGLVFPDMYATGADMLPDVYADKPNSRLPCAAPDVFKVLDAVKTAKREGGVFELENFEAPRDALLDLLVTTLSPDKPCFAHKLLGLHDALLLNRFKDDPLRAGEKLTSARSQATPGLAAYAAAAAAATTTTTTSLPSPINCLDAVLLLMGGLELVLESSEQAVLCYELVYRLCASPATNLVVLGHLRKESNKFIKKHLTQCVEMLRFTDAQILDKCGFQPGQDGFGETQQNCVSRVKFARLNCCAWLLKICALELRALHMTGVTVQSLVDGVVRPLFGVLHCQGRSSGGGHTDHATLLTLLLAAADIPDVSALQFSSHVKLKIAQSSILFAEGRGARASSLSSSSSARQAKVVDKFVFSRLCKDECDRVISLQSGGMSLGSSSAISQHDYEDAMRNITLLNRYIVHVSAARNLCEGWNQCVGMALFCHKIDDSCRFVSTLLLPTLQVITSQHRLDAEMPELLASAVFSMVSALCREAASASTQSQSTITALLDTDQHRSLLAGLINAAVLSTHREEPSARYRGYMIQSIGMVLTGLSGCAAPQAVASPSLRETIGDFNGHKLQQPQGAGWCGLREEDAVTYRAQAVQLLDQNVTALVDMISRDACSGPVFLRLSSLSTLQAIFSVLSPAKSFDPSLLLPGGSVSDASNIQALQVLVHRGHMQQMLSVFRSSATTSGLDELDERELFLTTASLCVQIGCSVEGVDALVNHGSLLQRLLSLSDFAQPPPARDDIMLAAPNAPSCEDWEDSFLAVLRLLRVVAAMCPTRCVLAACAEFLRENHASVTYLLRLRHKSLYGMALLEAVLAVIVLVASAPSVPPHDALASFSQGERVEACSGGIWRAGLITRDGRDGTFDVVFGDGLVQQRVTQDSIRRLLAASSSAGNLWDSTLGKLADSFSADICGLLRTLGALPYPSQRFTQMDEAGTGTWWVHIRPTDAIDSASAVTREQLLQSTPARGRLSAGMLQHWTLFDTAKADYSLRILAHAAAFLRLRASILLERGGLGLVGSPVGAASEPSLVELESVVIAFTTCLDILRKRGGRSSASTEATAAEDDRHDAVAHHLSSIVDNLSCVVHDVVATVGDAELRTMAVHVDAFLEVAATSSPHSFVSQVYHATRERVATTRSRG